MLVSRVAQPPTRSPIVSDLSRVANANKDFLYSPRPKAETGSMRYSSYAMCPAAVESIL